MPSRPEIKAAITSMGQSGGILLTDTTAITGSFCAMLVLTDAAFTTLTTDYTKNDSTTLAVAADWGTLSAGFVLAGNITACTLASGSVLLLR